LQAHHSVCSLVLSARKNVLEEQAFVQPGKIFVDALNKSANYLALNSPPLMPTSKLDETNPFPVNLASSLLLLCHLHLFLQVLSLLQDF
jgi:hypothetical protein